MMAQPRNLRNGAEVTFTDIGAAIGVNEDSAFAIYHKAVKNFKLELEKRGIKPNDILVE